MPAQNKTMQRCIYGKAQPAQTNCSVPETIRRSVGKICHKQQSKLWAMRRIEMEFSVNMCWFMFNVVFPSYLVSRSFWNGWAALTKCHRQFAWDILVCMVFAIIYPPLRMQMFTAVVIVWVLPHTQVANIASVEKVPLAGNPGRSAKSANASVGLFCKHHQCKHEGVRNLACLWNSSRFVYCCSLRPRS